MAQARGVGVPTPEVLGVEQVDHDGELLSFSIQRLVPGRSLDELAGELPASDLERLVMDAGELREGDSESQKLKLGRRAV